jgi:hypothetical protein
MAEVAILRICIVKHEKSGKKSERQRCVGEEWSKSIFGNGSSGTEKILLRCQENAIMFKVKADGSQCGKRRE